ncbi:MAG: hypothetical protein AAGA56_29315 [Myxococcota bacterium]
MSDAAGKDSDAKWDKGQRAAIVKGKGAGVRGSIFWSGANKYGPGMRYGLRGDDGETYWVDEFSLGSEEGAPPAPPKTEGTVDAVDKGTTVRVVAGPDKGKEGEVFWTGRSRYRDQPRYGVRTGEGEDDTAWVDHDQVEVVAAPAKKEADPPPPPVDEGGLGDLVPQDELPPEAMDDDYGLEVEYEDDPPF